MRRDGFTLIELLVVVAVITIVLAMTIPILRDSKKGANETAIIGTRKALVSANEQYRLRYGVYAPYAISLAPAVPQLLGNTTLGEYQSDYRTNGYTYSIQAWPRNPGVTADRSFWVDTSGVIRVNLTDHATSTDPPLK